MLILQYVTEFPYYGTLVIPNVFITVSTAPYYYMHNVPLQYLKCWSMVLLIVMSTGVKLYIILTHYILVLSSRDVRDIV